MWKTEKNGAPAALWAPGVVTFGSHVFLLGGAQGTTTNRVSTIWRGHIQDGGSIASWKKVGDLPRAIRNFGALIVKDVLVIFGGDDAGGTLSTVYTAKMTVDGPIRWKQQASLPAARNSFAFAAYGAHVYVIGGGGPDQTTYSARVEADGSINRWVTRTPPPAPSSGPAAVVEGSFLFLVGGRSTVATNTSVSTIWRAAIGPDGSLGKWQVAGDFISPTFTHGAIVFQGRLYILGGVKPAGGSQDTMMSAPIFPSGAIGKFDIEPVMPVVAQGVRCLATNDRILVVAGFSTVILTDIYSYRK